MNNLCRPTASTRCGRFQRTYPFKSSHINVPISPSLATSNTNLKIISFCLVRVFLAVNPLQGFTGFYECAGQAKRDLAGVRFSSREGVLQFPNRVLFEIFFGEFGVALPDDELNSTKHSPGSGVSRAGDTRVPAGYWPRRRLQLFPPQRPSADCGLTPS